MKSPFIKHSIYAYVVVPLVFPNALWCMWTEKGNKGSLASLRLSLSPIKFGLKKHNINWKLFFSLKMTFFIKNVQRDLTYTWYFLMW